MNESALKITAPWTQGTIWLPRKRKTARPHRILRERNSRRHSESRQLFLEKRRREREAKRVENSFAKGQTWVRLRNYIRSFRVFLRCIHDHCFLAKIMRPTGAKTKSQNEITYSEKQLYERVFNDQQDQLVPFLKHRSKSESKMNKVLFIFVQTNLFIVLKIWINNIFDQSIKVFFKLIKILLGEKQNLIAQILTKFFCLPKKEPIKQFEFNLNSS